MMELLNPDTGPYTIFVMTEAYGDVRTISTAFHDFPTREKAEYAINQLNNDSIYDSHTHRIVKLYR